MKRFLLLVFFAFALPAWAVDLESTFSWQNTATNTVTGIAIERQDGPSAAFKEIIRVGPTATSYVDIILGGTEGLLYCYRANPFNASGTRVSASVGCGTYLEIPNGDTVNVNVNIKKK